MTNAVEEVIKQADRIFEDCEVTAVQHFIASTWWKRTHLAMGVTATLFAALGSTLTFSGLSVAFMGTMSIVVAILAGLMTFLNPKQRSEAHHMKGVRYNALYYKASTLKNIETKTETPVDELIVTLKAICEQKSKIDEIPPAAPSGKIYDMAKEQIRMGQRTHRVDVPPKP